MMKNLSDPKHLVSLLIAAHIVVSLCMLVVTPYYSATLPENLQTGMWALSFVVCIFAFIAINKKASKPRVVTVNYK